MTSSCRSAANMMDVSLWLYAMIDSSRLSPDDVSSLRCKLPLQDWIPVVAVQVLRVDQCGTAAAEHLLLTAYKLRCFSTSYACMFLCLYTWQCCISQRAAWQSLAVNPRACICCADAAVTFHDHSLRLLLYTNVCS